MPERNSHGHSLIAALESSDQHRVLSGPDGRPGWLSADKGKVLLYDRCADAIRDQSTVLRAADTISQLASIEASTLRAPEVLHDDHDGSLALAITCPALKPPVPFTNTHRS